MFMSIKFYLMLFRWLEAMKRFYLIPFECWIKVENFQIKMSPIINIYIVFIDILDE